MKKILTLSLLFLLSAFAAVQAQVNFTVKYNRVNATTIDIVFPGTAEEGWHIYSINQPADGPTSATFNLDQIKGAKLKGGLKPGSGVIKKQEAMFDNAEVSFFEHKATFTQRIELTEKDYLIQGYLNYGACSDENCLPPTNVECEYKGNDGPAAKAAPAVKEESKEEEKAEAAAPVAEEKAAADSAAAQVAQTPVDKAAIQSIWSPVI